MQIKNIFMDQFLTNILPVLNSRKIMEAVNGRACIFLNSGSQVNYLIILRERASLSRDSEIINPLFLSLLIMIGVPCQHA